MEHTSIATFTGDKLLLPCTFTEQTHQKNPMKSPTKERTEHLCPKCDRGMTR